MILHGSYYIQRNWYGNSPKTNLYFYLKNSNLKQKKKKKNPNKQNQHLICFFPQNFFFEAKHKLGFWMD